MPRTQVFDTLGYVPAEPHFGKKSTYVDFYARDPITKKKRRQRVKFNQYRRRLKPAALKSYIRAFVAETNLKLSRGWNPWAQGEAPRSWYSMKEALDHYQATKERDTDFTSPATYRSWGNVFSEWCRKERMLDKAVSQFSRTHALRFLDHILDVRKVGNTTFNNYILRCSMFFIWCIEREYRTDNPFKGIKRKKKSEKLRTILSEEERRQCLDWFTEHDPAMVMVCLFVFHTLLRPRSDLHRVRVKDLDLMNGVINITGQNNAKGRNVRRISIPDVMLPYIAASPIMQAKPMDFIVGKGLVPGPEPCGHNTTGLRWNKMRDALGWSKDKVLYSLRDTGIVQLIADGVDLHYVMRQADHKNIQTTNIYVQHYFPKGLETVRQKATAFLPSSM